MNTTKGRSMLKKSGKYYVIVGFFILTIAVAHFVFQIFFIKKENLRAVETAAETAPAIAPRPAASQIIEIAPDEFEVKKIEVITLAEAASAAPRRKKEAPPARKPQTQRGKTPPRESRAARLRRAERILTGV